MRDTPTKIVTHANDCEYSGVQLRVLANSIASAREYDCEYSSVRLRVLECSFESTQEFFFVVVVVEHTTEGVLK